MGMWFSGEGWLFVHFIRCMVFEMIYVYCVFFICRGGDGQADSTELIRSEGSANGLCSAGR